MKAVVDVGPFCPECQAAADYEMGEMMVLKVRCRDGCGTFSYAEDSDP